MRDVFTVDGNLFYAAELRVENNVFRKRLAEADPEADGRPLPAFAGSESLLPEPVWEGHPEAIRAYRRTWEIAFGNLRKAKAEAGFVSDFIDTAFNGFLFMWDSSFIVMFGKYGARAFDFQKTLDNFYSHQHKDGFICREICEETMREQFSRDDPASTGPNVLPWAEWEYYQTTGDESRIRDVFDPLLAYHRWLYLNRSWPDGTYRSCGLACGMDNQPRTGPGYNPAVSHGHMSWIDACAQQYLSAVILVRMAGMLGRSAETEWLEEEAAFLKDVINGTMWSGEDAFYYDRRRNGSLSGVMTAGAYWTLLAGIVPEERVSGFISHLDNEKEFKRPNRVPSLSASDPAYREDGGYWLGGVWAPTNYMILKGLGSLGTDVAEKLAYEIASDYFGAVVRVFEKTGTLYENYAPEYDGTGVPAKDEFVGWTGLATVSVLFEYVFGIRPEALENRISWHVNLTGRHGVRRYPFRGGLVTLIAGERSTENVVPEFELDSDVPVEIIIYVAGKVITRSLPGKQNG